MVLVNHIEKLNTARNNTCRKKYHVHNYRHAYILCLLFRVKLVVAESKVPPCRSHNRSHNER